jgi:hypothetical protein
MGNLLSTLKSMVYDTVDHESPITQEPSKMISYDDSVKEKLIFYTSVFEADGKISWGYVVYDLHGTVIHCAHGIFNDTIPIHSISVINAEIKIIYNVLQYAKLISNHLDHNVEIYSNTVDTLEYFKGKLPDNTKINSFAVEVEGKKMADLLAKGVISTLLELRNYQRYGNFRTATLSCAQYMPHSNYNMHDSAHQYIARYSNYFRNSADQYIARYYNYFINEEQNRNRCIARYYNYFINEYNAQQRYIARYT